MQIPILHRSGQSLPYGSIPRINWTHPLSSGLVFCGYGFPPVDLVKGRIAKLNSAASAYPASDTSPNGQGPFFGGNSNSVAWPADYIGSTFAQSGTFSFFQVWYQFGTLGAGGFEQDYFALTNAATSEVFCSSVNSSGQFFVQHGGVALATAFQLTTKKFYVAGATVPSAATNASTTWVNGKNVGVGTWTYAAPGAGQFVVLSARDTGGNGFDTESIIFSSLIWNRVLSQVEIQRLYFDPYCFLWYPEDEIFASLVGSAFTWSQTSDDQLFGPKHHLLREMIRHD